MTSKQNKDRQAKLSLAHFDYEKGLNSYAFKKLSNHATGENLVQDTFMKTWVYLVKGGKIEIMKAFLYHILNNLIVDEYRRRKTSSLDLLIENGFEPSVDDSDKVVDLLDGKAAILLIKSLPIAYQKIMRMKYIQNLTLQEMALITGQPKNTMAVQAHRGLERLRILYNH